VITNGTQEKASPAAREERQVQEAQVTGILSRREAEVILALGQGLTQKQIAHRMAVAPGTVRSMAARAYVKLEAHDQRSAARRYRRMLASTV
jgi:DNA-binding NarL/FixJ family response regulator